MPNWTELDPFCDKTSVKAEYADVLSLIEGQDDTTKEIELETKWIVQAKADLLDDLIASNRFKPGFENYISNPEKLKKVSIYKVLQLLHKKKIIRNDETDYWASQTYFWKQEYNEELKRIFYLLEIVKDSKPQEIKTYKMVRV